MSYVENVFSAKVCQKKLTLLREEQIIALMKEPNQPPSPERKEWRRRYEIPSDPAEVKGVLETILARLNHFGWKEDDMYRIQLAVEEGIVNAIRHGNDRDNGNHEGKSVTIEVIVTEDRVEACITDEGDGFVPEEVPDPTTDANRELPSGRGLMLMRAFMSRVDFNDAGNSVTLVKLRAKDGEEAPDVLKAFEDGPSAADNPLSSHIIKLLRRRGGSDPRDELRNALASRV